MPDPAAYIAIGDIHGCAATLKALIAKMGEDRLEDRRIVFVGDYIDRGPDSKGVVDFLLEFRREHDCIFLRGNHEQMMLDALAGGDPGVWMTNGGGRTLRSYGVGRSFDAIPEEHLQFFRETRLYFDTPDFFFVHAGLLPGTTIRSALEDPKQVEEFLWERSHLSAPETAWEKPVVFGHTPRPEPLVRPDMIGIDTGCVYGSMGMGTLTAVLLPERDFIQRKCVD